LLNVIITLKKKEKIAEIVIFNSLYGLLLKLHSTKSNPEKKRKKNSQFQTKAYFIQVGIEERRMDK